MSKSFKTVLGLTMVIFTLSGCLKQKALDVPAKDMASETATSATYSSVDDVRDLIKQRDAEYALFIKQSRLRGMYGGALRGALLGVIVDADPLVVGSATFVGGYMGAKRGEKAASNFVVEHKNYIVRRWSLENIRHSVKEDSHDTKLDFLLTEKMKQAVKSSGNKGMTEKDLSSLRTYEARAIARAITLREVIGVYYKDPEIQDFLEDELEEQLVLIKGIKKNLNFLKVWA